MNNNKMRPNDLDELIKKKIQSLIEDINQPDRSLKEKCAVCKEHIEVLSRMATHPSEELKTYALACKKVLEKHLDEFELKLV